MPIHKDAGSEDLSVALHRMLCSQQDSQDTVAQYVAATLDGEFRGQDVVIEGHVQVSVTLRERATGRFLGGAEHTLLLPVGPEHQPPTDTDVLEVNPGTGNSYPEAVID